MVASWVALPLTRTERADPMLIDPSAPTPTLTVMPDVLTGVPSVTLFSRCVMSEKLFTRWVSAALENRHSSTMTREPLAALATYPFPPFAPTFAEYRPLTRTSGDAVFTSSPSARFSHQPPSMTTPPARSMV